MTPCEILDCEKPAKTRGMCGGHYARWQRGKPVDATPLVPYIRGLSTEERFWAKVKKTETCWLWTACVTADGYGHMKLGEQARSVHRLAYEWVNGPIPEGATLDHKCRVRHCVRPDHLQVVTRALNMQNLGVRGDNTSGVRGVTPRPGGLWRVRATDAAGVRHEGGHYKDLAEAEAAAIALRNKLMTNNLQDRRTA